MKSSIQQQVQFIKEVSLPSLNFLFIATLRTMLNLVAGRVKEGSVDLCFEQVYFV